MMTRNADIITQRLPSFHDNSELWLAFARARLPHRVAPFAAGRSLVAGCVCRPWSWVTYSHLDLIFSQRPEVVDSYQTLTAFCYLCIFLKNIRKWSHVLWKTDFENNNDAFVLWPFYPRNVICTEPDLGSEMWCKLRGVPVQQGIGVVSKLYLHDMWGFWYHCNTKDMWWQLWSGDAVFTTRQSKKGFWQGC